MMRYLAVLTMLLMAGAASAQSSRWYGFLAPGAVSGEGSSTRTYQMGGGGELHLVHGLGAGAELSAIGTGERFASSVFGLFSINGYYHFLENRRYKADPFVTAGYSLAFRTGTANLFNFGAGVNYWFHEKIGLLFEFRDNVWPVGDATAHYWGFRIGFSFRPE